MGFAVIFKDEIKRGSLSGETSVYTVKLYAIKLYQGHLYPYHREHQSYDAPRKIGKARSRSMLGARTFKYLWQ